MRSLLQFLGFASSTVCATLLAGILLTTSANADATDPLVLPNCTACCACNLTLTGCQVSGGGRGCTTFPCGTTCWCSISSGFCYKNP